MMRVKSERERGQALILFILALTVVFVMGAVAVDLGLWISERRGAQTDADASALAGAWELLDFGDSDAQNKLDAITKATAYLDVNEQGSPNEFAPPDGLVVDDICWDQDQDRADGVKADVNHKTKALFSSIFDIVAPVPGAHAKACAGAATGLGNVLPIEIDDNASGPCFDDEELPIFTSMCPIELGAQGANPARGILNLDVTGEHCSEAKGSGDIETLIENGAPGNCFVNQRTPPDCVPGTKGPWDDCVAIQPGNPKKVLDGIEKRLEKDGDCDKNFGNDDGTDDFLESVELFKVGDNPPYNNLYEARDCDPNTPGTQPSPRLVTIIVLEDPPQAGDSANMGYPIVALAGFYIAGCLPEGVTPADESDLNDDQKNCVTPGGPGAPPGHGVVWGKFVKLVVAGSGVGEPTDQTTVFSVGLVE